MMTVKKSNARLLRVVFAGVMAAMVYVVTLFRFPLLGSKVHFANAVCLLAGMLLGPVTGGLSAGLGSALYDAFGGGYDVVNVLITFVSKFAMAWVCGKLIRLGGEKHRLDRTLLASVAGALTYVALCVRLPPGRRGRHPGQQADPLPHQRRGRRGGRAHLLPRPSPRPAGGRRAGGAGTGRKITAGSLSSEIERRMGYVFSL